MQILSTIVRYVKIFMKIIITTKIIKIKLTIYRLRIYNRYVYTHVYYMHACTVRNKISSL